MIDREAWSFLCIRGGWVGVGWWFLFYEPAGRGPGGRSPAGEDPGGGREVPSEGERMVLAHLPQGGWAGKTS